MEFCPSHLWSLLSLGKWKSRGALEIAESIMSKAKDNKKHAYKVLLAYRNTIQDGLTISPVQRFIGQRTETNLTSTRNLLREERNYIRDKRDSSIKQGE